MCVDSTESFSGCAHASADSWLCLGPQPASPHSQPRSPPARPGQLEGLPVPSLSFLSQGSRSLLCFLCVFSVVPLFLTLSPVLISSQSLELVS